MHYTDLHRRLKSLEAKISDRRPTSLQLDALVRGSRSPVQAYGLSQFTKGRDLPIIVAVGINYTQGEVVCPRKQPGMVEVEDKLTNQRRFVKKALEAYEKHKLQWAEKQRASSSALEPPVGENFHLVMTNFCLWITNKRWFDRDVSDNDRELLLENNPLFDGKPTRGSDWPHLDQLANELSDEALLWIPHGLGGGSNGPHTLFKDFCSNHHSMNWIMTPNLSFPYNSYGRSFPN
jgi:hypothetical protein